MMTGLSGRDRRWLSALLVLGTLTVALLLLGLVVGVLGYFSDIILIFFLAWLLAFILSPVPDAAHRWAPRLPRLVVVVITYLALVLGLFLLTLVTAQVLASSITVVRREPARAASTTCPSCSRRGRASSISSACASISRRPPRPSWPAPATSAAASSSH